MQILPLDLHHLFLLVIFMVQRVELELQGSPLFKVVVVVNYPRRLEELLMGMLSLINLVIFKTKMQATGPYIGPRQTSLLIKQLLLGKTPVVVILRQPHMIHQVMQL